MYVCVCTYVAVRVRSQVSITCVCNYMRAYSTSIISYYIALRTYVRQYLCAHLLRARFVRASDDFE